MSAKEIEVECPCCKSRLTVDLRTERAVRWAPEGRRDAADAPRQEGRWDAAVDRVDGRERRAQDDLDRALDRERDRAEELERRFRDAERKLHDPE